MDATMIFRSTHDINHPVECQNIRGAFVQGDANAHKFIVEVLDNGNPVDLNGVGAVCYVMRDALYGGGTVTFAASISGNTVTAILPGACYALTGRVNIVIRLVSDGNKQTVLIATGMVVKSESDPIIDPGHEVPDIGDLLAQITRMEQGTAAAEAVVAGNEGRFSTAESALDQNGMMRPIEFVQAGSGYITKGGSVRDIDESSYHYSEQVDIFGAAMLAVTRVMIDGSTTDALSYAFYDSWSHFISGADVITGIPGTNYYKHEIVEIPKHAHYARFLRRKIEPDGFGASLIYQRKMEQTAHVKGWMSAGLTSTSGSISANFDGTRCISMEPLRDNVLVAEVYGDKTADLFALDANGYIGVWNGVEFAKAHWPFARVDIGQIRKEYPEYQLYIVYYGSIEEARQNVITHVDPSIPVKNKTIYSSDWFPAVVDVCETYFNEAYSPDNEISYASLTGLYSENTTIDGVKKIQCSELVYAGLTGTSYANSRYVRRENTPAHWGFSTDGTVGGLNYCPTPYIYPDYLQADQMAKYFDGKGMLIPFDAEHNNMRPGDLLFVGSTDTSKYPNNYKHIHHVGFISGLIDDGIQLLNSGRDVPKMIQAGAVAGLNLENFKFSSPANAYWYVRLQMPSVSTVHECVVDNKMPSTATCAAGASSTIISTSASLEPGFYTIFVDVDDAENMEYRAQIIYHATREFSQVIALSDNVRKKRMFIHVANGGNTLLIRGRALGENAKTVTVQGLRIYRGFVMDETMA